MASIMRLAMTDKVIENENVDVRESFFGLIKRAYYMPTESEIKVSLKDFDFDTGNKLKSLLDNHQVNLKDALASLGTVKESQHEA